MWIENRHKKTFKLDMIRGSLEWKTKHYSLFVFLLPARQTVQPLFNADLRTTMEITMTTMTMMKTLMMMLRLSRLSHLLFLLPLLLVLLLNLQKMLQLVSADHQPAKHRIDLMLMVLLARTSSLNHQQTMVNDHLVLIGWCLPPARLETLRMGAAEGREGPKGR